jgi:hypothetical protein
MPRNFRPMMVAYAVALSTSVVLLGTSGATAQDALKDGYYASAANPHPELPGFTKIRPSEVRIYANQFTPHPELTMPGVGVFASSGGGAPLPAPVAAGQATDQTATRQAK